MTFEQALALLDFARKVLAGELASPLAVAHGLLDLALDLAPVEDLRPYLTGEAQRRADAIVDRVEEEKLRGR